MKASACKRIPNLRIVNVRCAAKVSCQELLDILIIRREAGDMWSDQRECHTDIETAMAHT